MNPWQQVKPFQAACAVAALAGIAWLHLSNPEHWVRILDDANLIFHEAGHPLFGIFGATLGLYGGTLGQLVFPAVTSTMFWQRKEPVSFALCVAWFFENFWNISRYMADARAQMLPLVGGGEHDWTLIFSRWGVLAHDTAIAGAVGAIGWLGFFGCGAWIIFSCFSTNKNVK